MAKINVAVSWSYRVFEEDVLVIEADNFDDVCEGEVLDALLAANRSLTEEGDEVRVDVFEEDQD